MPISASFAREIVEIEHYLHRKPPVSYAYALISNDVLVGVVTFGVPASPHLMKSACPTNPSKIIELNRLWVCDSQPRNTESWFVSRALDVLPPHIVVSYADTTQGHQGYIYRALNFNYAGWTDMERKTPRFDYVVPNGKHSRDAFRSGNFVRVRRKPKVKYWIITGNRRQKHELSFFCGWPSLDWKTQPPPTD